MLDDYIEKYFATSDDGRITYSPSANVGKRYIIPDQEEKQKLINWFKRQYFYSFLFIISFPMVHMIVFDSINIERHLKSDLRLGSIVFFGSLFLICMLKIANKRLSRYECIAGEGKFSFREALEKNVKTISFIQIFTVEIVLLLLLAMSLFAGVLFPNDPNIGNRPTVFMRIVMICLFLVSLILFLWFLYLLFLKTRTIFQKNDS